jgi:hypothetical protein
MSKGKSRHDELLRESEDLSRYLIEKLRAQASSVVGKEDRIPRSPNAPDKTNKGPHDREKPLPTSKSDASESERSRDLIRLAQEQLQKYKKGEKGALGAGLGLEDEEGVKMTISSLPDERQAAEEQSKSADQKTVFNVKYNKSPDEVPITVEKIKTDKIGLA